MAIKPRILYLSFLLSAITVLLNIFSVPFVSEFFIKYFNLFSASVILISYCRLVGILNIEDIRVINKKVMDVGFTLIMILIVEFIISLFFQFFSIQRDPIFSYASCLTTSFGYILSRPLLRLNHIEVRMEKLENRTKQ